MNILGLLPKTKIGNRAIDVIIDRCTKPTNPTLIKKTTADRAASSFLGASIMSYGISYRILTDSGPHFVGNVFDAACVPLI